jgi:hypothetical protein
MAKRLKILETHADLCALLDRWVIHQMKSVTGGLGYPRKSLDFAYIQSPASSIDPTGYAAEDHSDTDTAFDNLCRDDHELAAAIKMHYMAWTIPALIAQGYPVGPSQTYYDRLKRAHVWLESELRAVLAARKAKFIAETRKYA